MKHTCTFLFVWLLTISFGEPPLTFADFVEVEKIEKVEISNYSGKFTLNSTQLNKFKQEISAMVYDRGTALKVGTIAARITYKGEQYWLSGNGKSNYMEIPMAIITKNKEKIDPGQNPYFKTNGLNLHNYKKQ